MWLLYVFCQVRPASAHWLKDIGHQYPSAFCLSDGWAYLCDDNWPLKAFFWVINGHWLLLLLNRSESFSIRAAHGSKEEVVLLRNIRNDCLIDNHFDVESALDWFFANILCVSQIPCIFAAVIRTVLSSSALNISCKRQRIGHYDDK